MLVTIGKKILLVLDNIDRVIDEEGEEEHFLQTMELIVEKVPKVKILTSGSRKPQEFASDFSLFELEPFSIKESVELFIRKIPD